MIKKLIDYLDGKINGKGKEYDKGNLIFEGEYLNGKKHGHGKEYEDGHLVFECEYKKIKYVKNSEIILNYFIVKNHVI